MFLVHLELKSLEHMSRPELGGAQKKDAVIGPAFQAVQRQKWPEDADMHESALSTENETEIN